MKQIQNSQTRKQRSKGKADLLASSAQHSHLHLSGNPKTQMFDLRDSGKLNVRFVSKKMMK
jgi:hypothetical protein